MFNLSIFNLNNIQNQSVTPHHPVYTKAASKLFKINFLNKYLHS